MRFLDLILSQLHNQFVSGGLVLLFTGSVIALLRAAPGKLTGWMKRRVTVEVEILNSDPLFDYVTLWLDEQPYSKRSRKLTATTANQLTKEDDEDEEDRRKLPKVFLSPAPGTHVFFYQRNILWLNRNREHATGPSPGAAGAALSPLKHESYEITILGRKQQVIRDLINEIVRTAANKDESIRLYSSSFGYWDSTGVMRPRKLDTVVLPMGVSESILADARRFLASEDWYRSVGIPWHRGYLLYGVPGSGKTSLVSALAGELGMDLYLMNIGGGGMNDERLHSLMSRVRCGTMVLMEDVDCTFPDRDSKDGDRVTMSGLLNCLDGVQSRDGCMIFMTTNFVDRLDAALTRPGRVDVSLAFGYATEEQILGLRDRIAPDRADEDVLVACAGKTMAEVQQFLLGPSIGRRAEEEFLSSLVK